MDIPLSNTGVIVVPRKESDWVVGDVSGVIYKVVCDNWEPHLPTDEGQAGVYFDTFACVTFSALNCLETQLNFLIDSKQLEVRQMEFLHDNGYLDDNGKVNFSDRFTAKMSGTTKQGNSLSKVWDSIRHDGLLPERDWDFPRAQRAPVFVWEDYYKEIPQSLKDKAKLFCDFFDVQYEWIITNGKRLDQKGRDLISYHTKQAPLQVATPLCQGWNTPPVSSCDLLQPAHATTIYGLKDTLLDYDHYNPYRKEIALDYPVPFALKGYIVPKPEQPVFEHLFLTDLVKGISDDEVKWLQKALFLNGCFYDTELNGMEAIEKFGGYFGENTESAVKAFQRKYSLPQTGLVREQTRLKLNSLFK